MKRLRLYTMLFALTFSGGLISCASDDNDNGYDVVMNADGGCPNVASFYDQLRSLDDSGWVRRHTVTMRSDDKNASGSSSPRANHLSILAFSNFEFTENSVGEYRTEVPDVTQQGCSTVSFGSMTYQVRESTPNSVRLAQMAVDPTDKEPDPAKKRMIEKATLTYLFTSTRTADVISHQLAIDPCYGDRMIYIDKTTRMSWGPAGDAAIEQPQEIDPGYITRATRALMPASVPASIRALSEVTDATTLVPVADLRSFKATPVRTDLKVCPFRPGPPDMDDPEMPPSATEVDAGTEPAPAPADPAAAPAPATPVTP